MDQDHDQTILIASSAHTAENPIPPEHSAMASSRGFILPKTESLLGSNKLIANATDLMLIHYQLSLGTQDTKAHLRGLLEDSFIKFDMRCQADHLSAPMVKSAKYVLAVFLDEAIMQTPMGQDYQWSTATLLTEYFNESWGGATFFKIRTYCLERIHETIDLLELIYLCLCLDFRGQYGTVEQGKLQLERIKRETFQAIEDYRGDSSLIPLSPHGQSDYQNPPSLKVSHALSLTVLVCAAILVLSYGVLSYFLSTNVHG